MTKHLVLSFIVVLLLVGNTFSSSCTPIRQVLTVRIDSNQNLFWSNWYEGDSLPKLLLSDISDKSNGFPFKELNDLFKSKLKRRDFRFIEIRPHPEVHYITVKNILSLIDYAILANYFPDLDRYTRPLDSLKADFGSRIRCVVDSWEARDNRIIQDAYRVSNIEPINQIAIEEDNQVKSNWKFTDDSNYIINVEWLSRSKMRPKVGIPKLIKTDDPISTYDN